MDGKANVRRDCVEELQNCDRHRRRYKRKEDARKRVPPEQRERRCHFIRSNVFWRISMSTGFPIFSRVWSIHFFSSAFLVGRSVS